MSLYGALFSGVSGLQAQSSAMGAIADNVTNVNTVGYKGTSVNFQTLITKQVSLTQYSAGGVQSIPRAGIDEQGLLQATTSATDLAISGNGFFVVNQTADPATNQSGLYGYARAGSFKTNKDGFLQNASGFFLQGWPLTVTDGTAQAGPSELTIEGQTFMKAYRDATGLTHYINSNIVSNTELKPLNLTTIGGTATATSEVRLGVNLPSGDAVGDSHETSVLVYDSLGTSSNVTLQWEKAAPNEWNLSAVPPVGASNLTINDANNRVMTSAGRIDFSAIAGVGDTIGIGGNTYTFVNGIPANSTQISLDTPSTLTSSNDIPEMATRIHQAIRLTESGTYGTAVFGGPVAAGTNFDIGTTTLTTSSIITSAADMVAFINGQSNNTGVFAVEIGGQIGMYNTNGASVTLTDTDGALAGDLNLVGLVLPPGTTGGERYTANGVGLEITQAQGGSSIAIVFDATRTYEAIQTSGGDFTVASLNAFYNTAAAIEFDGTGVPTVINPDKISITWTNGAVNMANGVLVGGVAADTRISMFLGDVNQPNGMSQLNGPYEVGFLTQNGAKFGNFAGVSVNNDGVVTALFDNGVRRPIFQIPLATFVNPNGLQSVTGNMWIETDTSGQYTLRTAGEAGSGTLASASLESSTVDLGEEFTSMITTQRAYSAAAKVITTSDEMLEELMRVKR